jgi:hypothetical protein
VHKRRNIGQVVHQADLLVDICEQCYYKILDYKQ